MGRSRGAANLFLCIGFCLLTGCEADEFALAPVSGKVLIDGQPVNGVRIAFDPIASGSKRLAGPEAVGVTDEEGWFTLSTFGESPRRGAVVGKCRVRIWTLPTSQAEKISNDRDPDYDPIKEITFLKAQIAQGKRAAKKKAIQPTGFLPLRYNDKTELTFDVPPDGTDKAEFKISWK